MLKLYIKYYKPYRKIFWSVVIGSCVTSLLNLLFPVLVRQMLDKELPSGDITGVAKLCLLMVALYAFSFMLNYVIEYFGHKMSAGMEQAMRYWLTLEKISTFAVAVSNKYLPLIRKILLLFS